MPWGDQTAATVPEGRLRERATEFAERLLDNVETVVHGKSEQIKLVLAALACGGHVLLEDVPGTAKTVLARAIAGSVEDAMASRVQCNPTCCRPTSPVSRSTTSGPASFSSGRGRSSPTS